MNIAKEGAIIQCCSLRGGQVNAEIVAYADAATQLESLPVLRLHSYTAPFWCRGDHLSHVSKLTWHSILATWNTGNQLSSVKAADQFVPPDVLFHLNSLLAFCKEHGLQLSSCRIGDIPTRHSQEVQVDEAVRFVFCRNMLCAADSYDYEVALSVDLSGIEFHSESTSHVALQVYGRLGRESIGVFGPGLVCGAHLSGDTCILDQMHCLSIGDEDVGRV